VSNSQLTSRYRPTNFASIAGQETAVEVLKSTVLDPERAPRSYILHGQFGTGKTTSVRVIAKALNCATTGVEPCGVCKNCQESDTQSPFYQEYDSSDVGNVDAIRALRDDFYASSNVSKYVVKVLDEAHLMSRQSQAVLLKVLEELPNNIFVFFCTTDLEKVLPTIRSRSIELAFGRVPLHKIKQVLQNICESEGESVPEEVLNRISSISRGHVRNAVMSLGGYLLMENKKAFLDSLRSSELDCINLLLSARHGDKEKFEQTVLAVCSHVLDTVREDYYLVLRNSISAMATGSSEEIYADQYKLLADEYGLDLFKLLKYSCDTWASNTFNSDIQLQAFLWAVFYTVSSSRGQTGNKSGGTSSSLVNRARAN